MLDDSGGSGYILIVDDMPANLGILSDILQTQGYQVRMAEDGESALEIVAEALPDLILLDIMMPGITGYEVARRLKANPATSEIPVIFISALDRMQDRVEGFKAGGVDYVAKPFFVQEVLARVKTHVALRQARRALQAQLVELQARNEELDTFGHSVAHDLRNPLNLVLGFAEVLLEESGQDGNKQRQRNAEMIVEGARKMNNIIEALLLLAGVRKMDVVPRPVNMRQPVEDALVRNSKLREERRAEVRLPEEWPEVLGYAPWIEEVWANYINNALKYGGEPPRLEIGSQRRADGTVHYWLQDNGAGLTQEEIGLIFHPFERLDQAELKEGHGLGLPIVSRIVQKLGGELIVESEPGKGSRFGFALRAASDSTTA